MRVTLDGIPIPITSGAAWTLKEGTAPHIGEFVFERSVAEDLHKNAQIDGSELIFDPRGSTNINNQVPAEFKMLTILGVGPTRNPGELAVTVADRRWQLKRKHIYRVYNMRRKTGRRRRVKGALITSNDPIVDDVAYARWSLKDGQTVWTADEVMTDLMDRVVGEGEWAGQGGLSGASVLSENPPVEGLEIDLPGDAAIAMLLQNLGGFVGITVNNLGKYIIYPRYDNGERRQLGIRTAGATVNPDDMPAIVGGPLPMAQNREIERPSMVRVLFTRVSEIRVDFVEPEDRASDVVLDPPPPRMSNVLPSPEDFSFNGQDYVVGQWIGMNMYFNYLGSAALRADNKINKNRPISYRTVNKGWLSGFLDAYGAPDIDSSGLWATRIQAIRTHYRLTFQIDRPWRDRIRALEPYRVSIQDPETGTRAPATVFANYCIYTSWRALGKSSTDPPEIWDLVKNRYGAPAGRGASGKTIVETDQAELIAAPALACVIDQDQCIIRIEFGTGNDVSGQITKIVRSALTKDSMPTDNTSLRNQYLYEGALEGGHQVSIILTAHIGAPSGNRRFHVVEVSSEDGQDAAHLPGFKRGKATGPIIEVRVPPTIEPARFGWSDQRLLEYSQAFDFDPSDPDNDTTKSFGEPLNADQIEQVALAMAARVYQRFVDRAEGGITTPLVRIGGTGTRVKGVVGSMRFRADPSLGLVTDIMVPNEAPGLSFEALLPPQYRRVIGRMVDLGG